MNEANVAAVTSDDGELSPLALAAHAVIAQPSSGPCEKISALTQTFGARGLCCAQRTLADAR